MWGDEGARSGYLRGWFAQKIVCAGGDTAVAKWHNGLFPGTSTLVFHLPGRFSFALFLNRDLSPQPQGGKEGMELSRLAGAIKDWPTADLFPEMGIPSFAPEQRTAVRAAEHTGCRPRSTDRPSPLIPRPFHTRQSVPNVHATSGPAGFG